MTRLSCILVDPPIPARACVIWMHGLGADGHDFEAMVPELKLPPDQAIRFIFPHAPVRPVTLNGGVPMRAWFDIHSTPLDLGMAFDHVEKSSEEIVKFIHKEMEKGLAPERIVLAGFSQGGVIAYHCGLNFPRPLAGIIALSTYLPDRTLDSASSKIPVYIGHGINDPLIPIASGRGARMKLEDHSFPVTYREYAMPHSVCSEEIDDISRWLIGVL